MTVARALASARHEDAPLLLAHVLGKSRSWLVAHAEESLEGDALHRFQTLTQRRAAGEPLAYILGSAGFYGREFTVDASVLVPRPETEHLIDDVVASMRAVQAPRLLDVGTGSGAIAVTLAAELPAATVDAVDISPQALSIARANAERLGVSARVRFFEGDLLEPVQGGRYDAIIANLPYVPTPDIAPSPDPVSYEPRLALDGGPDGLDCYRRLLAAMPAAVAPGGIVLLEAAPPLMAGLIALAQDAFPHGEVTVGKDYGQRDRYVKVRTRH